MILGGDKCEHASETLECDRLKSTGSIGIVDLEVVHVQFDDREDVEQLPHFRLVS